MPDRPTRPAPPKKPVAVEEQGATPVPAIAVGRRRLLVGGVAAGPVLFAASTRSALAAECRSPSQVFSGNLSQPGPTTCDAGESPNFWKQHFQGGSPSWAALQLDRPTIDLKKPLQSNPNQHTWLPNGTGAETLDSFFPPNPSNPASLPSSRIHSNDRCTPGNERVFDFGISFAALLQTTAHMGELNPVVPTMRGLGLNCEASATYEIDDRDVSLWEVLAFPDDVSATLGDFASVIAAAYLNSLAFPDYPVKPAQIIHMWTDGPNNGYCPTTGCGGAHIWDIDRIMQYLVSTWTK